MELEVQSKAGHRERLKAHFIAGDDGAYTDETLLELLLTYAIPQKDVQPLAKKLIATFGSLSAVLSADIATLCKQEGIKEHSAVLIKLTDWIRKREEQAPVKQTQRETLTTPTLFPEVVLEDSGVQKVSAPATKPAKFPEVVREDTGVQKVSAPATKPAKKSPRAKTGLFVKPLLNESMDVLPQLPDTESLAEVRNFLSANLHFNGQTTRDRYAYFITQRMFPDGYADLALRTFARTHAGQRALRDVCFYRLCRAQPVMLSIIEDLLLPSISAGQLPRSLLRDYLAHRFPAIASINDYAHAIIEALVGGGLATADRLTISFTYRDIAIESFAFVLHSEFPEPGMFDIGKVEQNRAIHAMLWKPATIVPALYELRNRKIISKVSEIDTVRQFTTKYTLEQVCEALARTGTRS